MGELRELVTIKPNQNIKFKVNERLLPLKKKVENNRGRHTMLTLANRCSEHINPQTHTHAREQKCIRQIKILEGEMKPGGIASVVTYRDRRRTSERITPKSERVVSYPPQNLRETSDPEETKQRGQEDL